MSTFVSGGMAAFTYWAFGIPIDNVKNRILSTPLSSPIPSAAQVARHVYRTQGWQGFYAGFVPVVLRAFPVNAAAYFVYESLMKTLGAEKTRS
ncbi:hypothetical protein FRC03_008354 [Tulasnella sp. 419]|nr:hypothetical protein FRC03_008354 [Tulasnella sp. 419]